jgi:predicted nucleotidyltransferase
MNDLLCKMKGGSHSYGLDTMTSDVDWRGVFVNTEVKHLIGLERHEHQVKQDAEADEQYMEFRNALKLLRGANTQMVELLYNQRWLLLTPEWQLVIRHRKRLVDSEKLFSCLKGYMQGELRLANGERTGKLGGKRKEAIDKYGFSPKNFVQLLRLAWAGKLYFERDYFPVHVGEESPSMGTLLYEIKTEPKRFTKEQLNDMATEAEAKLVYSFENRNKSTTFDEDLANQLCLRVYAPRILKKYAPLTADSAFK